MDPKSIQKGIEKTILKKTENVPSEGQAATCCLSLPSRGLAMASVQTKAFCQACRTVGC